MNEYALLKWTQRGKDVAIWPCAKNIRSYDVKAVEEKQTCREEKEQ